MKYKDKSYTRKFLSELENFRSLLCCRQLLVNSILIDLFSLDTIEAPNYMIALSKIPFLTTHLKPTLKYSFIHSFEHMLESSTCSSNLLDLLTLSIEIQSLTLCQQSHARVHRLGVTQHPLIAQKFIFSYCHFKHPVEAQLVFDSVLEKNLHIYNTLLSGYGKNQLFLESFELFREMCRISILPLADDFTFSVMFKAVGDFGEFLYGEMLHGMGVKNGLLSDTVVGNSLMSMYNRCGSFQYSSKVFDEMSHRNVSSWNAMIAGYANMNSEKGGKLFGNCRLQGILKGMQDECLKFDAFTVSTLLPLCGGDAKSDYCNHKCGYGMELHCYIVKNGLDMSSRLGSDVHLGCCLIDMYSKSGKIDVARKVFDRLKYKNVFAWTSMINGNVHCGDLDEALFHFRDMQWMAGVVPNKVSLVTILPACGSFTGLMGVKQIHGFAVRRELNHELSLCNALIDMYSKCGNLNYSSLVFEYDCIDKDAISWSSMIFSYGLHGHGQQAIILFDKMLQNGIKPDTTVVVGVLSACCRSGLLNDGIRIYDSFIKNYDTEPTLEMCSCMVDMLGRSSQLDRALDFIKSMPMEPGPSIWGALVCASALHGNSGMTGLAYKTLIQIEPENSSNYISLSNLHATSKRWDAVAKVRVMMRERGLRKLPGYSWITVDSATHSFLVADKSHACSDLIYMMLDQLVSTMKLSCYIPDFVFCME